jgi:predicted nucleotidyltransferase
MKPIRKNVDACVVALRDLLRAALGPDFVCLYHYGSRLTGGADPESDYDVLCVSRRQLGSEERDRLIDRSLDIQFEKGVVFDLHFYSTSEIETAPLAYTPFISQVQTEGVVV